MNQPSKAKRIFLSPPHMGGEELRFIQEAFESNYIAPLGPQVDAFEQEFAQKVGINHTVAVSSGTAAMHLVLRLLDVGPGDEIFASTLTFIGSVTPILFQGATPVFIDSDRTSWCLDASLLAKELEACKKVGKLPKAVVPTDLYGQCCNYGKILGVCEEYGVPVIADAAEAMGSRYNSDLPSPTPDLWHHAGKGARAAVFSFNGNKILTTSGGGMLASDDRELVEQARFLSQQARDPAPHYEHSTFGYNYRMSNILAAIGRGQLRVLEERVKRRQEIFAYYQSGLKDLPGIEFMPEAPYGKSNRWLTVTLITPEEFGADREQVRLALEAENIEARPVWKPMHLQPVFRVAAHSPELIVHSDGKSKNRRRALRLRSGSTTGSKERKYAARVVGGKVAEDLFNRGLCLPSGTAMTDSDLDRIISVIHRCRK
jgi:dTDP-4-amino-4,6-dideoxygalactose transaminase